MSVDIERIRKAWPLRDRTHTAGVDCTDEHMGCALHDALDEIAALRSEVERLTRERDEARALAEEACRRWNDALRLPTCIYCGHSFPAGTPAENADVAKAHAESCEKHPMSALRSWNEELAGALRGVLADYDERVGLYGEAERKPNRERVMEIARAALAGQEGGATHV